MAEDELPYAKIPVTGKDMYDHLRSHHGIPSGQMRSQDFEADHDALHAPDAPNPVNHAHIAGAQDLEEARQWITGMFQQFARQSREHAGSWLRLASFAVANGWSTTQATELAVEVRHRHDVVGMSVKDSMDSVWDDIQSRRWPGVS